MIDLKQAENEIREMVLFCAKRNLRRTEAVFILRETADLLKFDGFIGAKEIRKVVPKKGDNHEKEKC